MTTPSPSHEVKKPQHQTGTEEPTTNAAATKSTTQQNDMLEKEPSSKDDENDALAADASGKSPGLVLRQFLESISAALPLGQRIYHDPNIMEQAAYNAFAEVLDGKISVNDWVKRSPPTSDQFRLAKYMTSIIATKAVLRVLMWYGCVHMTRRTYCSMYINMFGLDGHLTLPQLTGVKTQFDWLCRTSLMEQSRNKHERFIRVSPHFLRRLITIVDATKPPTFKRRDSSLATHNFTEMIADDVAYASMAKLHTTLELDDDIVNFIVGALIESGLHRYPGCHFLIPRVFQGSLAKYQPYGPLLQFFGANQYMYSKKKHPDAKWAFLDSGVAPYGATTAVTTTAARISAALGNTSTEPMEIDSRQPLMATFATTQQTSPSHSNTKNTGIHDHQSLQPYRQHHDLSAQVELRRSAETTKLQLQNEQIAQALQLKLRQEQEQRQQRQWKQRQEQRQQRHEEATPTLNNIMMRATAEKAAINPPPRLLAQATTPSSTSSSFGRLQDEHVRANEVHRHHPYLPFDQLMHKHVIPPSSESGFPNLPRPRLPPPTKPSRFYSSAPKHDHH